MTSISSAARPRLLRLVTLCCWLLPACADAEVLDLVGFTDFIVDEDKSLTLTDAIDAGTRWQPVADAGDLALGLTRAQLWLRVRVPAAVAAMTQPRLLFSSPILDRVEFHAPARHAAAASGDGVALDARPLRHRQPVFPLAAADAGSVVYLRIASTSPMRVAACITTAAAMREQDVRTAAVLGAFYGLMVSLFAYNLALSAATPHRSTFYYLGWMLAVTVSRALLDGLPGAPLALAWWPPIANIVGPLFGLLTLAFGVMFCRSFLQTGTSMPRMHHLLGLLLLTAAFLGVALPMFDLYLLQTAMYLLIGLAIVLLATTIVTLTVRGQRQARFLALTFAVLATGIGVWMLQSIGAAAPGEQVYAMHLAIALEAILLSFAVADRIQQMRNQTLEHERQALAREREFAARLVQVQESERRGIAAELHDAIGQNALFVRGRLTRWRGARPPPEQIDETARVAAGIVEDLRAISHRLHPSILDRLGLRDALVELLRGLDDDAITIVPALDACREQLARVAAADALVVYRILQEAANNVRKHARATRCELGGEVTADALVLTLSDNGTPAPAGERAAGLGLTTMGERARMARMDLEVSFTPAGTRVTLAVPTYRPGAVDDESPVG